MLDRVRLYQSDQHRARAHLAEDRARASNDHKTRLEWEEIAIEWHLLATSVANQLSPELEVA
jgi:hypothetical protein